MELLFVEMDTLAFVLLNVPVSLTTILMNIVFIYSMFFTKAQASSVKPPLKALLFSSIGSSLVHNIFNLVFVLYDFVYPDDWLYVLSSASILFTMKTGFSSALGLQVCYYFQIVPVRNPVLVWMKQNIKPIMYIMLVFDKLFFLSEFAIQVTLDFQYYALNSTNSINDTDNSGFYVYVIDLWLRFCYLFLGLIIMLTSGIRTALYLRKHIQRMEGNGNTLTAFGKRQQMRVTIMGIIQSVLFFFASGWFMTEEIVNFLVDYLFLDRHLVLSVMALYSFGATILLGVGQAKFRLVVKNICKKVFC